MRILFIAPYLPSLIRVRPYNLLRALAQRGHRITLLALHPAGDDAGGLPNLCGWCESVHTVPLPRWRPPWNALLALGSGVPFQAAYSRSPQIARLIQSRLAGNHYDVIHLEHLRGAELGNGLGNGAPPVVFDAVDSIYLLFQRTIESAVGWKSRLLARLDLDRTRRYEAGFARRFSRVLVTSPEDCQALASLSGQQERQQGDDGRLVVLPNGVDLDYFRPLPEPRHAEAVIFSGKMSYHANIAAAFDLVHSVMPLVWSERPETQVWLVGKDPPPLLRELAADPRVTVTGTVPDIRPYVGRATVAVSPLRYNVGIQNKVLEAMAMGTPVVTTPGACRALMVEPGLHLHTGDSAPALAQAINTLLGDEAHRRRLGEAGRRYVEAHHDWDNIAARLELVYREAIDEARVGDTT